MKLPPLFNFAGTPKFTTDGCSGYMTWAWLRLFGRKPPWDGVCVIHDWIYWQGGSSAYVPPQCKTRREADDFLFRGIHRKGYKSWAWVCWLGTRAGGSQYLPFSWRWRYRESYWKVMDEAATRFAAWLGMWCGRLFAWTVYAAALVIVWDLAKWLLGP